MNVQDVLINGAGGAAVAFIGSFVISLFRTPKLLDDDRAAESEALRSQVETLKGKTESADPAEAYHLRTAREAIDKLSDRDIKILKHLWRHGPMKARLMAMESLALAN